MRLFRRSDQPPVGLEIGRGGVKVLQLQGRPGGSTHAVLAARPLPAAIRSESSTEQNCSDAFRAAAQVAGQIMSELHWNHRRVVTCMPEGAVLLRTLRIPARPGDAPPSDQQVRRQTGELFGSDEPDVRTQYLYAGIARHGAGLSHEFYAATSPAGVIDRFVAELGRAGIEIDAIDLAPCAVFRAVQRRYMGRQQINAIADMGDEQTQVIIGMGGRICLMRSIPIGASHLRQAISARLGISPEEAGQLRRRLLAGDATAGGDREAVRKAVWQACRGGVEALAGEVGLCFRYYQIAFRGPQPKQLLVVGPDAHDPQIWSLLARSTGLQVSAAQLLNGLSLHRRGADLLTQSSTDWALPLGLALRALPRASASTLHSEAA